MEGYIKLYRKMLEWEWFKKPPVVIVFMFCLLSANFKDYDWQGENFPAGSFITSFESISKKTGLTIQQTRTAIRLLKSTYEVASKATNKYTVIYVENWAKYQSDEIETSKQNGKRINKQLTNKQQTTNKQLTTDKEIKELEEIKELKNKDIHTVVFDFWNLKSIGTKVPKITQLTEKRKSNIKSRLKDFDTDVDKANLESNVLLETIERAFKSDFLTKGTDGNKWIMSFDWVFESPNNFIKVYEGNYDNKVKSSKAGTYDENIRGRGTVL